MNITTFRTSLLVLVLLFTPYSWSTTISVAAIDWCPQICPDKEEPGYIIDIVKEVFEDSPYELQIAYYPWSRAIQLTQSGMVDALLSPAKKEAPTLSYPDQEVGIQRMCFFTDVNSPWNYQGESSLAGQNIGIATDTSIEELNGYIARNPDQFQFQPYVSRYIKQSIGKLEKKRIHSFLMTYNSTVYELANLNVRDQYRVAGCVNTTNVYMAFTPKGKRQEIIQMIKYFDQSMEQLHAHNKIEGIMNKYQLSKWR